MVLPSGVTIEYMFGSNKKLFDKFRYNEYVFLFYARAVETEGEMVPYISLIKDKDIKYIGTAEPSNEFIASVLSNIDINSVSLATVASKPVIYPLTEEAIVGEAKVRR